CFHACAYCLSGDTTISMGDGSTRPLADIRVGDVIHGTIRRGGERRYARTRVVAHWRSVKQAFRNRLDGGAAIIASGDHRFLTTRGWRTVARGTAVREMQLEIEDSLLGVSNRTRPVAGGSVKASAGLSVVAVEPLGIEMPMYDISTGTGDFIANG